MGGPGVDARDTAEAALARFDVEAGIVALSTAIRQLTAAGDRRGAALACARLAYVYGTMLGNLVAAAPWLARGERLLADEPPCVEQGWVAVALMGCDVPDPDLLRARADLALDRARRFDDRELEIKALADGGLARVQAGEVDAGMAMLDESMALACGDHGDVSVRGRSACSLYTACYYTADFPRAASWSEMLRRAGLLDARPGATAILNSHCELLRAMTLMHLGRWTEAEAVLVRADAELDALVPGASWHPPIGLAELRLLQGRLDEAEVLLLGRDDHVQALLPLGRLHLARGDAALARATAARGLRRVGADRVRAIALLGVVVEASLALDDHDAAATASVDAGRRAEGTTCPSLRADAARITALVDAAAGRTETAADRLREGLDALATADLPYPTAMLHLALARVLEPVSTAAATSEARAALALLDRLDVVVAPGDAALLTRLGPPRPATTEGGRAVAALSGEGRRWSASCGGTTVRLRDTKGVRYLAALVARPGTERHCLELVDLVEGVDPTVDRRLLGDAGPAMDAAGRRALRRHVEQLRERIDDAVAAGDDDAITRAQTELDDVVAELARSFGLGGRARRASAAAERARLNVTRSLRTAIASIADGLPEAAAALDRRIRTGSYCAYLPEPGDPIVWTNRSG